MTGHAITLRSVNLLAGETRVVSSISGRCADATAVVVKRDGTGCAMPFSRPAWASARRIVSLHRFDEAFGHSVSADF